MEKGFLSQRGQFSCFDTDFYTTTFTLFSALCLLLTMIFETGPHYEVQAGFKLIEHHLPRFPNSGIKGVSCHTSLHVYNLKALLKSGLTGVLHFCSVQIGLGRKSSVWCGWMEYELVFYPR